MIYCLFLGFFGSPDLMSFFFFFMIWFLSFMKIHCHALTAKLRILDFFKGTKIIVGGCCSFIVYVRVLQRCKGVEPTKLQDCGDARLLKLWLILGNVWVSVKND